MHVVRDEHLRTQLQTLINSPMRKILDDALEELGKLCDDEAMQPITYNHYFTDNMQKARQNLVKADLKKAFDATMDSRKLSGLGPVNSSDDRASFLFSLQQKIEVRMDYEACLEASSALASYYKVAMKTFVDNVCRQVVERHIMKKLPSIFEPSTVVGFSDEEVARIAAEPDRNISRRKELQDLFKALQNSLDELQV